VQAKYYIHENAVAPRPQFWTELCRGEEDLAICRLLSHVVASLDQARPRTNKYKAWSALSNSKTLRRNSKIKQSIGRKKLKKMTTEKQDLIQIHTKT
jgi:hypothetical protein